MNAVNDFAPGQLFDAIFYQRCESYARATRSFRNQDFLIDENLTYIYIYVWVNIFPENGWVNGCRGGHHCGGSCVSLSGVAVHLLGQGVAAGIHQGWFPLGDFNGCHLW